MATAVSDRQNLVMSDDGKLRARLASPSDDTRKGAIPDQVFAAGYAACFNHTITELASSRGLATGAVWVTARVSVKPPCRKLRIELVAEIPELTHEDAEALVRAAFDHCPYSQAMRGNIEVDLRVA